jgi:hypothetical protein
MSVNEILSLDAQYRKLGVTDDLFDLDQLRIDQSWSFDCPTLVKFSDKYKDTGYVRNIETFKKNFYANGKYRILNNIDMEGLLIAGGAVRSVLLGEYSKDVDVFVYGYKTTKEAIQRIEKFIKDLYTNISNIKSGHYVQQMLNDAKDDKEKLNIQYNNSNVYDPRIDDSFNAYYNGHTITLMVDNSKIQIILRLYSTASEILHGFDLGSSATGFDGTNVFFTSLSKFCYENMVNIFDGSRRSTTYEVRLIKYFDKGFNIVLPNFDITKLTTDYFKYNLNEVCEMPYLTFSYDKIDGNLVYADTFYNVKDGGEVVSDYDFYDDIEHGEDNYKLAYYNLGELLRDSNRYVFHKDLNEELNLYMTKKKSFTGWTLDFNSNFLKYGFVEYVYNRLQDNLSDNVIKLDLINKYFNIIKSEEFINNIYLSNLPEGVREKKLQEIFKLQKTWIKNKLNDGKETKNIKWVTENPTTQLTSSFNPIIEDNKLWYGDYFTELAHNFKCNEVKDESNNEVKDSVKDESEVSAKNDSDNTSKDSSKVSAKDESDNESKASSKASAKDESDNESKASLKASAKDESDNESKASSKDESDNESKDSVKDESDNESKASSKDESNNESKTSVKNESDHESKASSKDDSDNESKASAKDESDHESKASSKDDSDNESKASAKDESDHESKDSSKASTKDESDNESKVSSKVSSKDSAKDESDNESKASSKSESSVESLKVKKLVKKPLKQIVKPKQKDESESESSESEASESSVESLKVKKISAIVKKPIKVIEKNVTDKPKQVVKTITKVVEKPKQKDESESESESESSVESLKVKKTITPVKTVNKIITKVVEKPKQVVTKVVEKPKQKDESESESSVEKITVSVKKIVKPIKGGNTGGKK